MNSKGLQLPAGLGGLAKRNCSKGSIELRFNPVRTDFHISLLYTLTSDCAVAWPHGHLALGPLIWEFLCSVLTWGFISRVWTVINVPSLLALFSRKAKPQIVSQGDENYHGMRHKWGAEECNTTSNWVVQRTAWSIMGCRFPGEHSGRAETHACFCWTLMPCVSYTFLSHNCHLPRPY